MEKFILLGELQLSQNFWDFSVENIEFKNSYLDLEMFWLIVIFDNISGLCIFSRYLRILEKQRVIDEAELESLHEDRGRFLQCALHNYLKCLQAGDKHDLRVFRMTSLWFENASSEDINVQLKVNIKQTI